jgi:hypothetical protein
MIYLLTAVIIYGLSIWIGLELKDISDNKNFIQGKK